MLNRKTLTSKMFPPFIDDMVNNCSTTLADIATDAKNYDITTNKSSLNKLL